MKGMMSKRFNMIAQIVGYALFERAHDFCVQRSLVLVEQSPVGHFIGKSMLERVLQLGEKV